MIESCKACKSKAINRHMHGRDDKDLDLCDVCYWRKRAHARQYVALMSATAVNHPKGTEVSS